MKKLISIILACAAAASTSAQLINVQKTTGTFLVTNLNSITSATSADFLASGNGGTTLTLGQALGGGLSSTATLNGVLTIGGGTGTYVDYLLKINGWNANTKDAGIGLTSFSGGSPLVDFVNGDTPSGKGRIGRNLSSGNAALFTGTAGDAVSGFQIGTRDSTPVQLFTADNGRVFLTSGGLFGVGAFTQASQPDTLFHVLGAAKITGLLTGASGTFSSTLAVTSTFTAGNGTFNVGASGQIVTQSGGASGAVYKLQGAAGQLRYFEIDTATTPRWLVVGNDDTETGSGNSGTNFELRAYSDAGSLLSKAITIVRATGAIAFSGPVSLGTAGNTVSIKSGSNAAAGTFTMVAGSATVTSTAIDANTTIQCTIKTVGGTTGVYTPLTTTTAGSFTATSIATDTSTYNWVAMKVN